MRLYHGSHIEVRTPRVLTTSRSGDFGRGFYTTTSLEQARRWAQIRAEREELSSGVVSTFEVPDSIIEHPALSVKTFAKADSQWLDFVMSNRMDTRFEHQFDLVYGPVANDRVYVCLNALENGTADRASVTTNNYGYNLFFIVFITHLKTFF